MTQTVHILATIRNQKLWHAALLVFKTLRTGFPTANICVWGNQLNQADEALVGRAASAVNAVFKNLGPTTHGKWIETLVFNANEPFWICDTDIVFFDPVEKFGDKFRDRKPPVLFAGRHEPDFMEEWTGMRHVARLHPSLMWFNPAPLRAALRTWPPVSEFFSTVRRNLFEWEFVPVLNDKTLFYDTCAGLHHALGGTPFTNGQNEAFEHLHCGTYADLIGEHLTLDGSMVQNHRAIFMQPEMARGIRAEQEKYYAAHKPKR